MNPERHASTLVLAAHLALTLALSASCLWAVAPSRQRVWPFALGLCAWLGLSFALARSGWLLHFESAPPRMAFLLLPGAVLCVVLAWSPFGRRLIDGLPLHWLVGFQAFRIGVELVLWRLFEEGLLPVQMTFEGQNLDVLSGALALVVAVLLARGKCSRWHVGIWNVLGLLLLLNITLIALRSMPGPWRAYANEPANTIVLGGIFVWIPALYVLCAWFGHMLVFRALLRPGAGART